MSPLLIALILSVAPVQPAKAAPPLNPAPSLNPAMVVHLLEAKKLHALDQILGDIQRRFERGQASEFELRNAYRPFYKLPPRADRALEEWAAAEPHSYPAHLAHGIHLRKQADAVRGGKWFRDTPEMNIVSMNQLLGQSKEELERSLKLTAKPYLSLQHLMAVTWKLGLPSATRALLDKADKILPHNRLARVRYMDSLTPRWGGSYAAMNAYIQECEAQGVDVDGLDQLRAMMYDDMGDALMEANKRKEGLALLRKALQLAKHFGPNFPKDVLYSASFYLCRGKVVDANCL